MTVQQAIQQLEADLTQTLDKWLDKIVDDTKLSDAQESLGYYGDDLARIMAKAAIAPLEACANLHEYLKREQVNFAE